jgi:hypothetical protein
MLAKTTEENRIIKQELDDLKSAKVVKDPNYKANNYYHLIKASKRRHKSHGAKLGLIAHSHKKSRVAPSIRQSIEMKSRKSTMII